MAKLMPRPCWRYSYVSLFDLKLLFCCGYAQIVFFQHQLALYDVLHRPAIQSSCVSQSYTLASDNVCCLVSNSENRVSSDATQVGLCTGTALTLITTAFLILVINKARAQPKGIRCYHMVLTVAEYLAGWR